MTARRWDASMPASRRVLSVAHDATHTHDRPRQLQNYGVPRHDGQLGLARRRDCERVGIGERVPTLQLRSFQNQRFPSRDDGYRTPAEACEAVGGLGPALDVNESVEDLTQVHDVE